MRVLIEKFQKLWKLWKSDNDFRKFIFYILSHPWEIKPQKFKLIYSEPPYLQNLKIESSVSSLVGLRKDFLLLNWQTEAKPISENFSIKLASIYLKIEQNSIPWSSIFEDVENTFALHRFAWLLPLLVIRANTGTDKDATWDQTIFLIKSWILANLTPQIGFASWQAYTVSERLVNWILAALACGQDITQDAFIADSLSIQATYLRQNLEYLGDRFTGNHLSNNGRALYLVGLTLNQQEWIQVGRSILLQERQRLFPEPQFLREGSSHYQFLVTRNYCEVLWFAKQYGDRSLVEALTPTVCQLVKGCQFFLVNGKNNQWCIPYIGDLSPDCSPDWLLGVPWMGANLVGEPAPTGALPTQGWHQLFLPLDYSPDLSPPEPIPSVEAGREWARVYQEPWQVYCHINPTGYPNFHAHQDSGSLCVFYQGLPLLVDCGRQHYLETVEGRRGWDSVAHSILSINQANPTPYRRQVYPEGFLRQQAGELPHYQIQDLQLETCHGGFARFRGVGQYRRKIFCKDQTIQIIDDIAGTGFHRVRLVFHIPFRIETPPDGRFTLNQSDKQFQIQVPDSLPEHQLWFEPSPDFRFGWGSRYYGDCYSLSSLVVQGTVQLPWTGITTFARID